MPNVRVNPLGIDLEATNGETIMEAAERLGYRWPTICGGVGMCTMCWVRIEEGAQNLSPMKQLERDALETGRWRDVGEEPDVRLACQATPLDDVTVFKRGVNHAERAGVYR